MDYSCLVGVATFSSPRDYSHVSLDPSLKSNWGRMNSSNNFNTLQHNLSSPALNNNNKGSGTPVISVTNHDRNGSNNNSTKNSGDNNYNNNNGVLKNSYSNPNLTGMNSSNESIEAKTTVNKYSGSSHRNKLPVPLFKRADGGLSNEEGNEVYFFTVIDILQQWNWKKKLENSIKSIANPSESQGISAVPPDVYRERFVKFLAGLLE
jgi:hypothetical protein